MPSADAASVAALAGDGLRVLIVTPWPEGVTGGVQTTTRILAEYLISRGHQVDMLAPTGVLQDTETERPRGLYYRRMRMPFDPAHPIRSPLAYALTAPGDIVWIRRFLNRQRIDVVNIHFPLGMFTNVAVASIGGPPLVVSVHGSDLAPEESRVRLGRGVDLTLRLAAAIICPSETFAQEVGRLFPRYSGKLRVVSHGIEATDLDATEPPWPRRYILYVGGLRPIKNVGTLIRAFGLVAGRNPNVDLVIAGSGPLRDELTTLCSDLDLRDRVQFLGSVPPDAVGRWQDHAAVVAAPCPRETFGLAVAEAMIRGRPVVVAANGALQSLVEDGVTGLVASAEDPDQFGHAIERLLRDQLLATTIGQAGRETVRRRFSPAAMVQGYERVFNDVLAPRSHSSTSQIEDRNSITRPDPDRPT